MPKVPGMPQMPMGPQSTYNSTMSNVVNPALDKATSGNIPPFLQMLLQNVKGLTGGQGSSQPTPVTGGTSSPTPNNNMPSDFQDYISKMMGQGPHFNHPSMPAPTPTPQPEAPQQPQGGGFWHGWNPNGGMPSPSIANTPSLNSPTTPFSMPKDNGTTIGSQAQEQPQASGGQGGVPPAPANNYWSSLNSPGGGPGYLGKNSWVNAMPYNVK